MLPEKFFLGLEEYLFSFLMSCLYNLESIPAVSGTFVFVVTYLDQFLSVIPAVARTSKVRIYPEPQGTRHAPGDCDPDVFLPLTLTKLGLCQPHLIFLESPLEDYALLDETLPPSLLLNMPPVVSIELFCISTLYQVSYFEVCKPPDCLDLL